MQNNWKSRDSNKMFVLKKANGIFKNEMKLKTYQNVGKIHSS